MKDFSGERIIQVLRGYGREQDELANLMETLRGQPPPGNQLLEETYHYAANAAAVANLLASWAEEKELGQRRARAPDSLAVDLKDIFAFFTEIVTRRRVLLDSLDPGQVDGLLRQALVTANQLETNLSRWLERSETDELGRRTRLLFAQNVLANFIKECLPE